MRRTEFVSAESIKQKLSDFVLFDIRTPQEYGREHVPSSVNVPINEIMRFDFSPYKDKKALFLCRSGMRTQGAAESLLATDLPEVFCLEGGLNAWKASKLPIFLNQQVPIDVMRQVQIIAGGMILAGVFGFFFWSQYWIGITLFVGFGLVFAGVTGFCGMSKILSWLPMNRPSVSQCAKTNQ